MFGWELPPFNSGGLGTACLGLTEELVPRGIKVDFVLPHLAGTLPYNHMPIVSAGDYATSEELQRFLNLSEAEQDAIRHSLGYGNRLIQKADGSFEVSYASGQVPVPQQQSAWYAHQAASIAEERNFNLIHCHEWMTYSCGIAAKQAAKAHGKQVPFIAQVHATEIDRGGSHGNAAITQIEQEGLEAADRVIAVSHYTKAMIHRHYGISKSKISVVHNGIDSHVPAKFSTPNLKRHYKLVLFMGRITHSKGPEHFLRLAKAVTSRDDSVKFLMVGSGDMEQHCIEQVAKMGLTGKVLFNKFLRGSDVDRAYQMADLFVMPSVSEPFGLVALEALKNGTPAIVSKQSGVAEVSDNLVKVDFWDLPAMEKAVIDLLYSPAKASALTQVSNAELQRLSWERSAAQLHEIYTEVLTSFGLPSAGSTLRYA